MENDGSHIPPRKLNRKQRRAMRQQEKHEAKPRQESTTDTPGTSKPKPTTMQPPSDVPSRREKFNETLSIVSFAFTVASWGWSVVAPDSSVLFGSILLFVAVLSMLLALFRVFRVQKLIGAAVVVAILVGFGAFDWHVVVKPQRGKPFKELLDSGYHLTEECGNHPAREPMPTWMRDGSKAWQAQVQQLVAEKLDPKDLQIWRGAIVMGLVSDENMTAYQCMWLNEKVAALETIINAHYDPALKHQEYQGPLYWLESVDGKVDVTEAMKNGATRFTIHEKPSASSTGEIHGNISN